MKHYGNIQTATENIEQVFDLYRIYGSHDYIGEGLSQVEHAMQCASQAAKEYPNNLGYILGAFLHDIGHLLALDDGKTVGFDFTNTKMLQPTRMKGAEHKSLGLGLYKHELVGAEFLKQKGFPSDIYSLGANHVLAKRYLVTQNPDYFHTLSDASKATYWKQGGSLILSEMKSFLADPNYPIYIKMRSWDDAAKMVRFNYEHDIAHYENMALDYVLNYEKS